MSVNISDVVRKLLDGMHTMSKTETIIGEPLQAGEATLIPIHRLKIGFAAATAQGKGSAAARKGDVGGQAAGGSVQIDPVAVIAVGADGKPRVLAVDGESEGGVQRLLDQAPDLVMRALRAVADRAGPALVPIRDDAHARDLPAAVAQPPRGRRGEPDPG